MVINSNALQGIMKVYAAIKPHRDQVPGLNVVAAEMGDFFKKAGQKYTPEETAAAKCVASPLPDT